MCLNADGFVTAANQTARQMLPLLAPIGNAGAAENAGPLHHSSDLFAIKFEALFDAARANSHQSALDVPLWSGLRLNARALSAAEASIPIARTASRPEPHQPLKEIETALIRRAVDDARGNVLQAAKELGVSRATVYRRLGSLIKRR